MTDRQPSNTVALSGAQARALNDVADGLITRSHPMGWFQKGGFRRKGGRNPHPATMEKLHDLGFIRYSGGNLNYDDVILTPEGRDFLGR